MDIGGFRDMHRHRRCIQIGQEFTTKHGYDAPEELEAAGARRRLRRGDAADRERGRAAGCDEAEPRRGKIRSMRFRSASASGLCSRWILPKWFTSLS